MLGNLGMVGVLAGDLETAKSRFVESLQVARLIDNRLGQYWTLAGLGWHAANSRQLRVAARLLGAAEAVAKGAGADRMGRAVPMMAGAKDSARGGFGAGKFEADFGAGKPMSRDLAGRLALGIATQAELG